MLEACLTRAWPPMFRVQLWTLIDFLSSPQLHGWWPWQGAWRRRFGRPGVRGRQGDAWFRDPGARVAHGRLRVQANLEEQRAHVGVSIKYKTNRFPTISLKLKTRDSKHCLIAVGSLDFACAGGSCLTRAAGADCQQACWVVRPPLRSFEGLDIGYLLIWDIDSRLERDSWAGMSGCHGVLMNC